MSPHCLHIQRNKKKKVFAAHHLSSLLVRSLWPLWPEWCKDSSCNRRASWRTQTHTDPPLPSARQWLSTDNKHHAAEQHVDLQVLLFTVVNTVFRPTLCPLCCHYIYFASSHHQCLTPYFLVCNAKLLMKIQRQPPWSPSSSPERLIVVHERKKQLRVKQRFYLPWLRSGEAESYCDSPAPSVLQTSSHQQQAVWGQKSNDVRSRLFVEFHRPCFRRSGARQRDWSHFRCGKVNPDSYFFPSLWTNVWNRLFARAPLSIIKLSWHKY